MRNVTKGYNGWAAVVAVVAVADLKDGQTMSQTFKDLSRNPVTAPFITITWVLLTMHLFGLLPEKLDPFHSIGKRFIK